MGRLVEDMTRLVGEIQTLRASRQAFVRELAMDVSETCADFAATHARMAKQSRDARLAFVNDLKQMAKQSRDARLAFVNDLKQNVAELRRQIRADLENLKQTVAELKREISAELAGAHCAWFGKGA